MGNIYLFSQNCFYLLHSGRRFYVNKNSYIKIENADEGALIYDELCPRGSMVIDPREAESCPEFRVWDWGGDRYIEIISCGNSNFLEKQSTKNAEVYFYKNAVTIVYKNVPYSYYYRFGVGNIMLESGEAIYIFNDKFLLIFSTKNMTFKHFYIEKYQKDGENIEILCRIAKNVGFLLLYQIDLKNMEINKKRLKKEGVKVNEELLPYMVFYLAKNEFMELKTYLNEELDVQMIFEYFSKYENIYNIDGKYYLTSMGDFTEVKFKMDNNLITEID